MSNAAEKRRIERQIANILVAQAMVEDIPDENIIKGLGDWANDDEKALKGLQCGSAACFGGWVAIHPHFRKQGISRCPFSGAPEIKGHRWADTSEIAQRLFGESDAFATKGNGFADQIGGPSRKASEREVIQRRLRAALENRLVELEEVCRV